MGRIQNIASSLGKNAIIWSIDPTGIATTIAVSASLWDVGNEFLLGEDGKTSQKTLKTKISKAITKFQKNNSQVSDGDWQVGETQALAAIKSFSPGECDTRKILMQAQSASAVAAQTMLKAARKRVKSIQFDKGSQQDTACRQYLQVFLETLVQNRQILQKLQMACLGNIENIVIRLEELANSGENVTKALTAFKRQQVFQMLHSGRQKWDPEQEQLAAILKPHFEAVELFGRKKELKHLADWCEKPTPPLTIQTYWGEGGTGKTRLMMEAMSRQRKKDGWICGFLSPDLADNAGKRKALFDQDGDLLITIDYADNKSPFVTDVINAARKSRQGRVRLVLLARQTGDWYDSIVQATSGIMDGPAAKLDQLPPVITTPKQRQKFFHQCINDFSALAGKTSQSDAKQLSSPNLKDYFDNALIISMAALSIGEGIPENDPEKLFEFILKRERKGWGEICQDDLPKAAINTVLQTAVVMLVLLQGVNDRKALKWVSEIALKIHDRDDISADTLTDALHRLYPPEDGNDGAGFLQPDRIGEWLTDTCLRQDHGEKTLLISFAIAKALDNPLSVLTVLERANQWRPQLLPTIAPWVEPHLPDQTVDFAKFALLTTEAVQKHGLQGDLVKKAGSLNNQSIRLSNLGQHELARQAAQEAVDIYRELAQKKIPIHICPISPQASPISVATSPLSVSMSQP